MQIYAAGGEAEGLLCIVLLAGAGSDAGVGGSAGKRERKGSGGDKIQR